MSMHRPLIVMLVAAFTASGCAVAMTASSHVDRGVDFSMYDTYRWGPADVLPAGDPRLDRDPFFQDHLQGAVEKQLALRDLRLVGNDDAELLIHYHANVVERINPNLVDRAWGICQSPECVPEVERYEAGTLVLDVVDARSQKLIWRGWAQTTVDQLLGDRARVAKVIEAAIERMLETFPRTPTRVAAPSAR